MIRNNSNILNSIGNTALVELKHVVPDGCARILLKLESHNPTGSMKDRMARAVISGAVSRGELVAKGTVVEYTGGSTGTSLAFVCAAIRIAARLGSGHTVATVACDSGLKYLSTDLYAFTDQIV